MDTVSFREVNQRGALRSDQADDADDALAPADAHVASRHASVSNRWLISIKLLRSQGGNMLVN